MQSGSLHAIVPLLHKLELHLTTAVDGGRSEITGDWFHSSLPHSAHQASGCEPSEGGESIKRRLSSHSAWLGSHGRCFARTFGKFTSAMPLAPEGEIYIKPDVLLQEAVVVRRPASS